MPGSTNELNKDPLHQMKQHCEEDPSKSSEQLENDNIKKLISLISTMIVNQTVKNIYTPKLSPYEKDAE